MKLSRKWKALIALLAVLAILVSIPGNVFVPEAKATSSSEIKKQLDALKDDKAEIDAKIADLEAQLDQTVDEMEAIVNQKNLIDQEVFLLHEQIANTNAQIAAYGVLIADKQEELVEAQTHQRELSDKNRERVRAMEEDGALSYWSVLFKANSFSDLLDRLNMIEEIASSDQRRLKELDKAAQEVEDAKLALEAEKLMLEDMKAELEATQKDLEEQSVAAQQVLTELVALGAEYEDLMDQYEEEQKNFIDELEKLDKEYDEQKYKEHMATATTAPKPTGSGNGGKPVVDGNGITWVIPCSYTVVTSAWGYRTHPISGKPNVFHNGVDLAGGNINGKPVYATRAGVITFAGWNGNGGWTIKIDHLDGYSSYYMHLSAYNVKVGDYVVAGQQIGKVGSTGGSTGPHLHFEIRKNGNSLNPMNFIG